MEYGLTDKGFVVKPFEKIKEELQADYRRVYGDEIDLSPSSVAGAKVNQDAIILYQIWELLGALYSTEDVNSAKGVYLDRLASFVNVSRIAATYTTVDVAMWGNNGTTILKGNTVKDLNGFEYLLQSDTAIGAGSFVGAEIKIKTAQQNDEYTMKINDATIDVVCGIDEDKEDIKIKIKNEIEEQFAGVFVFEESDDDILKFHIAQGTGKMALEILTNETLELKQVASIGKYDCAESGAIFVGIGAITEIVTNQYGLNSVVNYVNGETGVDAESDDAFRIAIKTRQKRASGNEVAIKNAVLDLSDVSYCEVYSNRTMTTDGEGRPAKSYECVVIGGNEDEIAKTIFETGPAGVQAYGNIEKEVVDDEGFSHTIGFSRPANKYVWIKIGYGLNAEEYPPEDIASEIKNKVLNWCQKNITVGQDFIFQKLFAPIYEIQGLTGVEITCCAKDTQTEPSASDYAAADIVIPQNAVAVFDASRISATPINED